MAEPRYDMRAGGDLVCLDCGAVVAEQAAHTRFHSILSGHAWALAVLKTRHLSGSVHDKYDVVERINSKQFDSWSGDALAEVMRAGDSGRDSPEMAACQQASRPATSFTI